MKKPMLVISLKKVSNFTPIWKHGASAYVLKAGFCDQRSSQENLSLSMIATLFWDWQFLFLLIPRLPLSRWHSL